MTNTAHQNVRRLFTASLLLFIKNSFFDSNSKYYNNNSHRTRVKQQILTQETLTPKNVSW